MNKLNSKQASASLKNVRISPQKLNLMASLISGKHVQAAINQLDFSHKRISGDVKKLLNSAIANAENNNGLDIDNLYVKEAWVGKAMVMKRFHARARGRGARVEKHFSHMTIVVEDRSAA
jgi:large subunit ribosomal protein L22